MPATNELLQEGRYRICQQTDGSGNVFEAYDTVRNTNVIVREIPLKLNKVTTVSQQESLKLAFANQAKALTEIDHATLLHVQDYFSEIDRQFLVMEAVEGVDLRDRLTTNKRPFSVREVTAWADELLDALNYLHGRKPPIIHLDIRPENLKVDASGKVKLHGFSVETSSEPDPAMGPNSDEGALRYSPLEKIWPGLDAASQKVITNSYDERSERILKEPADARTDIYSLGATLYFLITGTEPVDALERSIEVLEGKLDPLREPSKVNPQIPAEISDVLMKSLEIKRENRYDSALIMRQVLNAAIAKVEDRVNQDVLDKTEAAEVIRKAAHPKTSPTEMEKHQVAEAESQRKNDLLQKQLREAEEQRHAAEHRAAEIERLERQKEEAEKAALAAAPPVPDDDLLEIPVSSAPEVVAYRDSTDVDEAELAAVLEELEVADRASGSKRPAGVQFAATRVDASPSVDGVQVFDNPIDLPPPADNEPLSDAPDFAFSSEAKAGSRLPIPVIAGGIGLAVVIAIAAWMGLSGTSGSTPPVPLQTVEVAQPPLPEPSPVADDIISTADVPSANTAVTLEATTEEKPATVARQKKAEPAKPAADKKKAVTVDDLINDN